MKTQTVTASTFSALGIVESKIQFSADLPDDVFDKIIKVISRPNMLVFKNALVLGSAFTFPDEYRKEFMQYVEAPVRIVILEKQNS